MCDPICGNCGNKKSEHYFEFGEVFCFTHTTGDIFTDTPRDEMIFNMILDDNPDMYDEYLARWKKANGHT